MRRMRAGPDTDSLELLLDTICNVFGGIVLMAVLVVLQTQSAVSSLPAPAPPQQAAALEAQRLQFELDRHRQEQQRLMGEARLLEQTFQATVPADAVEVLQARQAFVEAIEAAQRQLAEVQARWVQARKQEQEAALTVEPIQVEVERKRQELEMLREQLREPPRSLPKTARLPHHHSSGGRIQVHFLIAGDRVYPFDNSMRSEHCIITTERAGWRVRPKPGAGYPVPEEGGGATPFSGLLQKYDPATHFISFWVRGDSKSFGSFFRLRASAVDRHYKYSVAPYPVDEDLSLYRGSPPVQ